MRKLLLTLSLMIAFTIQVVATNYTVTMKSQKKENPNNSTQVRRTPTHLPFEVIYDDETHKVIVSGDEAFIAHIHSLHIYMCVTKTEIPLTLHRQSTRC